MDNNRVTLKLCAHFPINPFVGAVPNRNTIIIRQDWWNTATRKQKIQVIAHELVHIHQWRTITLFPIKYAWHALKGHANNPYEIQANEQTTIFKADAEGLLNAYETT